MTGRIGPDYEIIRELRRGPWVTVYEAIHRVLGRKTLVKWLNPEHQDDEEMAGRLRREARLGAAVDHPNAARIYGVGEAEGRPFVAIEWIEGEDLESLLQREGVLRYHRVLQLADDLLNGLEAIHQAGVVHRDLSPANVRITEAGVARITDFGLATGQYDPKFTLPGSIVGTPGYLSPEQASGKEIDKRADLFACGVLLHEALTGTPLFKDKDLIATLKRVRNEPAPLLHDLNKEIPEEFSLWVDKLLKKSVDDRWGGARAAQDELLNIKQEAQDEAENSDQEPSKSRKGLKLPEHLFPTVAVALVIATLILVLQPEQKPPISAPGLVTEDSATAAVHSDSAISEPSDTAKEISSAMIHSPEQGLRNDTIKREQKSSDLRMADTQPVGQKTGRTVIPAGKREERALRLEAGPQKDSSKQIDTTNVKDGFLLVHTQPWANVSLNGRRVGATPMLEPLLVQGGSATLTLENPGFPPIVVDTSVYPPGTTRVSINLENHVGTIILAVSPWATVFVDDIPKGDTPLARPLFLSAGKHTLRLTHPKFGQVNQNLFLNPGERMEITVDMTKQGTPFAKE